MASNPQKEWNKALADLAAKRDLSATDSRSVMEEILAGSRSTEEIAEFLARHTSKGGTALEVAGFIDAMYAHAAPIAITERAVDTVGTGGDGFHTINISTTSAIVAASAGARVVKHGNRAATSQSGAADVLEALGVKIDLNGFQVAQLVREIGLGFCFAPMFHSAMRHAGPARKSLGYPTIFNILGPLTNPAGAPNILMGVFHSDLVGIQIRALQRLGAEHALVVYGRDGMDEVSLGASTLVGELKDGHLTEYEIHPEDFGMAMASHRALRVETPEESQAVLRGVLNNEAGAARDIVILNAGAALYAANVTTSIKDGIALARQVIESGAAKEKLAQFVAFTQKSGSAA